MARPLRRFSYLLLVALGVGACSDQNTAANPQLSSPWGMTVAGRDGDMVVVANHGEDTLHVLGLPSVNSGLTRVGFIESPTPPFALRIPAGSGPSAVAASPGGDFVVSLALASGALRLSDVADRNSLVPVVDSSGEPVELPLGGGTSAPGGLVAAPASGRCLAPCLGQFYVTLTHLGIILEVELIEGDPNPSLQVGRVFELGGAPSALAMHPSGAALFFVDGASDEVVRVGLENGLVNRTPLGAAGGVLTLSRDGKRLLVARPALRDLLVFSGADGNELVPEDANTQIAPTPRCLAACAPGPSDLPLCTDAHPADEAVCTQDAGLASAGPVYSGLYLGTIPAQLIALGEPPSGSDALADDAFIMSCLPRGALSESELRERRYTQTVAVVGTEGFVRFVGLERFDDAVPTDRIDVFEPISALWCQEPEIAALPASSFRVSHEVPPERYFESCPSTPLGRQSYLCAADAAGGGAAVAAMTQGVSEWTLEWEAVVLNRSLGGGTVSETGDIVDLGVSFAEGALRAGDRVEILTCPNDLDDCDAQLCGEERLVTAVSAEGEGIRITLDPPLDPERFGLAAANLRYRVRVGRAFLLRTTQGGARTYRVPLNSVFGTGTAVGRQERFVARLRDIGLNPDISSCDLYDSEGLAKAEVVGVEGQEIVSRDRVFGFRLDGGFSEFISGVGFDITGFQAGSAGFLPAGHAVSRRDRGNGSVETHVYVSYAGSDTILAFDPMARGTSMFISQNYRLIR